ncbi:MAG TPA: hypothetical protein DCS43_10355 [Verrucomicrobia bacterium]|nr:hypothetical protein [Verrucomicrobiota bacterium]
MKTAYSFVVLRYVHDVLTGEFVNIGVALYAPGAKYLGGLCNTRYGRLTSLFGKGEVDGDYFRGLMRYIEGRFDELGDKLRNELPLNGVPSDVAEIAKTILPPDDSSLQWSEAGGGQTEDPRKTLEDLFARIVARYENRQQRQSRDDGEVWRVFKREFETQHVISHLRPKRITAPDDDYEFEHAWKNQRWRVYEPLSFDMQEAESITGKANRWLGRAINLNDSPEKVVLHLLLGEPSLEKMRPAYTKAENILNKIPMDKVFVREHEAKAFSESLAKEMRDHAVNE